jgi:hypothetical protein
LYCVASTHTVLHIYRWERSGVPLSGSTPVRWVNNPGTYKCTIQKSEDPGSPQCCSREILVHGIQCSGHESYSASVFKRMKPSSVR